MTCKEKLKLDHPDWTEMEINYRLHCDCPSAFGYLDDPDYCATDCAKCWDREIPETDIIENKEENTVMSTTKKTKAELLEEIERLNKELEEIKNAELYQSGANQLKAMHAAYMNAGFTDEQSFELVLTMIKSSGNIGRK